MLVSIPIMLFIRLLFWITDNRLGSQNDVIGNMNKIWTRLESADGVEIGTDPPFIVEHFLRDPYTAEVILRLG